MSRLSVWWIKLDIDHQRIEPGQPQQNGAHERMHKTRKAETTRPPEQDLQRQQARFDRWPTEFNDERPHEALGYETPASPYTASPRPMLAVLPAPEYPGHFEVRCHFKVRCHFEVRYLSKDGDVRFKPRQFFVIQTLCHEPVGFEEVDDGVWDLYFFDRLLARLDERDYKLRA